MSFPATRELMEQAGYKRRYYTRCRGCMRPMEFWNTPEGKSIPMGCMSDPDSQAASHFATCPVADRFRKKER